MSDRSMWKMLHLLYTLRPGQNGLRDQDLLNVGIDCGPDTVNPLLEGKAVSYDGGLYALTEPARKILGACIVANRRWSSDDMWVDYPSAFVIMPFSQPWSETVYRDLIKPGVDGAGLECVRGDTIIARVTVATHCTTIKRAMNRSVYTCSACSAATNLGSMAASLGVTTNGDAV